MSLDDSIKIQYYAHSGIFGKVKPQLYNSHIKNVCTLIDEDPIKIIKYIKVAAFIAGIFHDIGKLSPYIQPALMKEKNENELLNEEEKLLNHVDLGVSMCFDYYNMTKHKVFLCAAIYCYCHHIGLINLSEFFKVNINGFFGNNTENYDFTRLRDERIISDNYNIDLNIRVCDYFDNIKNDYLKLAKKLNPDEFTKMEGYIKDLPNLDISSLSSVDFRMGMSIFIDADHGDTDTYYGGIKYFLQPRLTDSLEIVKKYQQEKQNNSPNTKRNELRGILFNNSCEFNPSSNILIDAPVGSGKTLSIIASSEKLCEEGTKKVIYLSPFNNINEQTYDVYNNIFKMPNKFYCSKAYCIPTFESSILRKFSYKLQSPITITSGVNFIETILSHKTSDIRLFKYLVNATIILDEYHALMPYKLYSVFINIMKGLNIYGSKIIFSSGTPCDVWNIFNKQLDIENIINSETYNEMLKLEDKRIKYINSSETITTIDNLIKNIKRNIGKKSILVVTNTRKNAYLIASKLKRKTNYKVYHISNNMVSSHIKNIINLVKNDILEGKKPILIGTNLIECGYDISFDIGYKELASYASIIQFGGRIKRNFDDKMKGLVIIFTLAHDDEVTSNPSLIDSINICKKYLDNINLKIVPDVIREEIKPIYNKALLIDEYFNNKDYLNVSKEKKIISTNTSRIIIDEDHSIRTNFKLTNTVPIDELQNNSVSIYSNKIEQLLLLKIIEEIKIGEKDFSLLFWNTSYHSDYGISPSL